MNTLKDEIKELKEVVDNVKLQVEKLERLIKMDDIAFELMVNQYEKEEK